jgi:hypothetical protein
MTTETPTFEFFTAGGTLPPNAPSYVKRPTDDELFRHIMAGEFCYVLTPRQMGKSSLMIRTAQRLSHEGVKSAIVDLTQIGTVKSEDQWYKGILAQIQRRLRIKLDPVEWWERKKDIPNIQKFIEFFEEVLSEVKESVVIFIDEIDTTLKLNFRDDFFAGIRAIFNARAENPDLKRITFVLLGVASPSDLIKDRNRTPFNIGQEIPLRPFSRGDARMLETGMEEVYPNFGSKILDRIFYWTNGHPYLTQKICQSVVENHLKQYDDYKIDELVEKLFISEVASRETNLQFVRDNVLSYPERRVILTLYKKLLQGIKVRDDKNSLPQNHLKLTGLALADYGQLIVSNRIYRNVFDRRWANQNTPNNWPKIIALASGLFSVILLSVFIYNFVVGSLSIQYTGNFYTNQSSGKKLENLAKLFELHGFLTNNDYDFRARELFYSLNWNDQTKLFKDPYISSSDKQRYLIPVVEGLYVTMADIEGKPENSDLLAVMRDSLKDVKTPESAKLQNEINSWLEARNISNDQDALDKYDRVIGFNSNNPATHYERAIVAIRLGQYEKALIDLNTTMGLAQNISSEASEKEIATPTQRLTKIPGRQTNTPAVAITNPITEAPQLPTQTSQLQTAVTTNITEVTGTPLFIATQKPEIILTPTNIPLREGYKSSFYSIAYIRSAIDLVIQENIGKPDFNNALIVKFSSLNNLRDAGLIIFSELANLATETAIAQQGVTGTPLVLPDSTPVNISCGSVISANLRRSPGYINKSDQTDVLLEIPCGTTILILGGPVSADGLNWWKVEISGYQGWVAESTASGRPVITFANETPAQSTNISSPDLPSEPWWISFESACSGNYEIYIVRTDGTNFARLTNNSIDDGDSAISPDEKRIAFFSERDGDREIYTMNMDGTDVTRLTDSPDWDGIPVWSPDGKQIAFTSWRGGEMAVYIMNDDGTNVRRLTHNPLGDWMPTWSPDGQQIAYVSYISNELSEIFIMNADGSNPRQLTHLNGKSVLPFWSPDGDRIVFHEEQSGQAHIISPEGNEVTSLPGFNAAIHKPWSPDGQQIIFADADGIYIMNADGSNIELIRETNLVNC